MPVKKILIVDDEKDMAECSKGILENTGLYEVLIEGSGENALETVRQFKPDLVLMDVVMPIIDGPEAVRRIMADDECRGVRIVFMTSLVTSEETSGSGGLIGGLPFIPKPLSAQELIDRVGKVFSQ
jgi:CheY-like chemotaxis protein